MLVSLTRGFDDLRNNSVRTSSKMRKRVHVAFITIPPGGHIGDRIAEPQKLGRAICCPIPYDDAVAYPETWVAVLAGLAWLVVES